jgi:Na+-transporting methylmalonyl-CoA/oxaloacetate decarboxylase beta subunit
MIGVGLIFIYLGIVKHYEPLLLVPIHPGVQGVGPGNL